MVRFLVAKALAVRLGDCTIANFDFPEWGFAFPAVDPSRYRRTLLIERIEQLDFDAIAQEAAEEPSLHIVIRHFLQRQSLFLAREAYLGIFPISPDAPAFGADHLLINIRAGDVLSGTHDWYPLVPVGFYRWLVEQTGLEPVFVGQLEPGSYIDALRAAFPRAGFIASQGARLDFDTIRRATNIVPAISTFSVVAAWLAGARRVFLPLDGFLNPSHKREIDLVPTEDPRYRFFLFPLNYALPELRALEHHQKLEGRWKEISRATLRHLKNAAPHIPDSLATPESHLWPDFDPLWYVHSHLDAAMEISEGWYSGPLQHYLDIGRLRGYQPNARPRKTTLPNLALGKRAWQSSLSSWSRGRSIEEDAKGAVDGNRHKDYGFHTNVEDNPWWVVDLGAPMAVREIHIYNRRGAESVMRRACPLLVETSLDGHSWAASFVWKRGNTSAPSRAISHRSLRKPPVRCSHVIYGLPPHRRPLVCILPRWKSTASDRLLAERVRTRRRIAPVSSRAGRTRYSGRSCTGPVHGRSAMQRPC